MLAAAEGALFPDRAESRNYPQFLPYSRITLNLFKRRPYRVRMARASDVGDLAELEAACWPEGLQVGLAEIGRRIDAYPAGQFVVEKAGVVVGACTRNALRASAACATALSRGSRSCTNRQVQ